MSIVTVLNPISSTREQWEEILRCLEKAPDESASWQNVTATESLSGLSPIAAGDTFEQFLEADFNDGRSRGDSVSDGKVPGAADMGGHNPAEPCPAFLDGNHDLASTWTTSPYESGSTIPRMSLTLAGGSLGPREQSLYGLLVFDDGHVHPGFCAGQQSS
ncbi:hypothetical protein V5O48_004288 [Marasmius crinis-equi]|uniref:Uncharacterized protein n=1 Tax=Marasmius crinis-equi TaxID=585013 RepID=A0ABR3FR81_9AGAR